MDFALGELALLPDVFWELLPSDYSRMARGYYRRIEDQYWEPARWLGTILVNINRSSDSSTVEPTDLLRLHSDPPLPPPPPPPTAEETAALLAELNELDKDLLSP